MEPRKSPAHFLAMVTLFAALVVLGFFCRLLIAFGVPNTVWLERACWTFWTVAAVMWAVGA